MQLKYIVLLLLCLVITFPVSSFPVLASSHGGSGGSHEVEDIEPSHGGSGGNHGEDTDSNHGGGGGQHPTITDEEIYKTLVAPFKVIWNWCKSAQFKIGSHSFTFADFFLFQILAGVVIWFIWYHMYYG